MISKTMTNLVSLRRNLKSLMKPDILQKLAELLETLGADDNSLLERYQFFVDKNGLDCRYASMSKQFFLNDHAQGCAQAINWLYHNWSKTYE